MSLEEKEKGNTLPEPRPLLSSVVNRSMQYCSTLTVQAPIKTRMHLSSFLNNLSSCGYMTLNVFLKLSEPNLFISHHIR